MFERQITAERASVDPNTGEFAAVLATDGEASDGNILAIEGAIVPSRMPLFVNHVADPRTQIGSLFPADRTEHELHVRGQILMDGIGAEADIRRDLALKLAAGVVGQMSVRWDADPGDVTRRVDLPRGHRAHVDASASIVKRRGFYFSKWKPREGSLVGIGADPAAAARFAEDPNASPAVAAFWRLQATPAKPSAETMLAVLGANLREAYAAGATDDDVIAVISESGFDSEPEPPVVEPQRDFWAEIEARSEARSASFAADLKALDRWYRGEVLWGADREAAARGRAWYEARRANERRMRRRYPTVA